MGVNQGKNTKDKLFLLSIDEVKKYFPDEVDRICKPMPKIAKDMKEYDNLSDAAYLRAKEDYLMGINFSRALTLKYGMVLSNYMKKDRTVIAVGRVMTCVQGMVVNREREIRNFDETPFYKVAGFFSDCNFKAEWKAIEGSKQKNSC